jgi:hypothetical protein
MSAGWSLLIYATWAVVVVLCVATLGLLRRITPILERAESVLSDAAHGAARFGIPEGHPIPKFTARDLSGRSVSEQQVSGSAVVLLFMGPGCAPCESLAAEIAATGPSAEFSDLVLVVPDSSESRRLTADYPSVLFQTDAQVSSAFETTITPNAFAVNAQGMIVAREVPDSLDAIRRLIEVARGGGGDDSAAHLEPSQGRAGAQGDSVASVRR